MVHGVVLAMKEPPLGFLEGGGRRTVHGERFMKGEKESGRVVVVDIPEHSEDFRYAGAEKAAGDARDSLRSSDVAPHGRAGGKNH
jgi:hypothetical protein